MLKKIVLTAVVGVLFGFSVLAQPKLKPGTSGSGYGSDPQANIGSTVTDPALTPAPSAQRNPANMPPERVETKSTDDEELSTESSLQCFRMFCGLALAGRSSLLRLEDRHLFRAGRCVQ